MVVQNVSLDFLASWYKGLDTQARRPNKRISPQTSMPPQILLRCLFMSCATLKPSKMWQRPLINFRSPSTSRIPPPPCPRERGGGGRVASHSLFRLSTKAPGLCRQPSESHQSSCWQDVNSGLTTGQHYLHFRKMVAQFTAEI